MLDPQVISTLTHQNPWHSTSDIPERFKPLKERPMARWLWMRLLGDYLHRFLIILGPRRTGKTVTMYQTVRRLLDNGIPAHRIWWVSLDHPRLALQDLEELAQFVISRSGATHDKPVFWFLDELVYADRWDLWFKQFYDQGLPIKLTASSSAASALRQGRLESGVGRWDEFYLGPCLLSEALRLLRFSFSVDPGPQLSQTLEENLMVALPSHVSRIRDRLLAVGGYPELLLAREGAKQWPGLPSMPAGQASLADLMEKLRSDAVERVIYRDIQQWAAVARPLVVEKLAYLLADRPGGLASPQNLARSLAISAPTVDSYLSYLEWAYMVFPLPGYWSGERATQRRGRKYYLVDPALRSAILQRPSYGEEPGSVQGQLVENLAASHLHALGRQERVRVFYWRHRNREVDLIYDDPRQPVAFEIALSRRHSRAGLLSFMEQHPRFRGHCYLVVAHDPISLSPRETTDGIGELPLDLFLLVVGRQYDQALATRLGSPADEG